MQDGRQILSQQQKLTLSPKMIQSLNLMTLPFAELREKILEETEKNPALEIVSDPSIVRDPPRPDALPRTAATTSAFSSGAGNDAEKSDANRDFLEKAVSLRETLQEHLAAGLSETRLPADVERLSALIIRNLDENGFHVLPPHTLPGGENQKTLSKALYTVRRLDPIGCAAANFRESLAVQAEIFSTTGDDMNLRDLYGLLAYILWDHFAWVEKGRADTLTRNLKKETGIPLSAADAEKMLGLLRSLDPFPGRAFPSGRTTGDFPGGGAQYVVPDITVKKSADGLSIKINEEEIPVVGLSPFFLKMKNDKGQEKATRDFAGESLREARWFMNSIKRRNLTVLKVARTIVALQNDFFYKGPKFLHPLRLKDVADETGLHEATVSRATSGKYLECEWGIFELRYFFSGKAGAGMSANRSGDGTGTSKQSVKEIIREIIGNSPEKLTDQAIADTLAARGIHIARRTVAKYRGEMDIGPSSGRIR